MDFCSKTSIGGLSNFVYFNLSKQLDIDFTREFLLDIIYVAAYDSGMLIKTYFPHSDTGLQAEYLPYFFRLWRKSDPPPGPEGGLGGM